MKNPDVHYSDILVIGGGIAGLFAAITARDAGADVLLVEKNYAGRSGSSIMGSGQLNVYNPDWGMDFEKCFRKFVRTGEYLNDRRWLRTMMLESWGIYEDMRNWGVDFPSTEDSFRTYMNSVHDWQQSEDGEKNMDDNPGWGMIPLKHREVPPKLRKYALKASVRIVDRTMITELILQEGAVCGAVGFSLDEGTPSVFRAKAVVLAGGKNNFRSAGMNIAELTGDANAMAYRAGAVLTGFEFPDLHMGLVKDPVWKGTGEIYPAYWNFVDSEGNPIPMMGFDLSMVSVIHAGKGPVMWNFRDMTDADHQKIENYIAKRGMPHETQRVHLGYHTRTNKQVAGGSAGGGPAEQTGGIRPTDLSCAASVPGLFAAGDCCCTWSWGAINAGAPPGLLPAGVTGKHAGKGAAQYAKAHELSEPDVSVLLEKTFAPIRRKGGFDPRWVCQNLQNTMLPYYVLHIKHADRLRAALTNVTFFRDHMVPMLKAGDPHELRLCHEVRNMVENAEMILRSSLAREESRGWHYREDFPVQDDEIWLAWVMLRKQEDGMSVSRQALPEDWLRDDPKENRYDKKWLAWEQEAN